MNSDHIPIHLSKATSTSLEEEFVLDALRSGSIAPLGPHVDAFEHEMAKLTGVAHAVALSSGTAALHLGLLGLGVRPGSFVVLPSMTFAATANAVMYTGATPVFVDSLPTDANVDPALMLSAIETLQREGKDVTAAIAVDIYGRPADYATLEPGLSHFGVPLLEDAAEAVGSVGEGGRPAGSYGKAAALSFNGNKIITTSGGGMLLSDDYELVEKARFRASQSRESAPWYEHVEIGYNYRLSNLLAALGRGQLRRLNEFMKRRQDIRRFYASELRDLGGVRLLGTGSTPHKERDNAWLTCIVLERDEPRLDISRLLRLLNEDGIEARHLWKPLHMQPVFASHRSFTTGTGEALFESGLCLPSGAGLTDNEVEYVISRLKWHLRGSTCRTYS